MQENFHSSKRLSKTIFKKLIQKNDYPALPRFVLMLILFLSASIGVVMSWASSWWVFILTQLSFGILCCSIFACQHETIHNTAFKSTSFNRFAATLLGILHIYPASLFRELHFTHHRYTHIPGRDPEISLGHQIVPSVVSNFPLYLIWITGLPFLSFKIGMAINGALGMLEFIRTRFYPFVRPQMRLVIALESIIVLSFYGILAGLAIYVYSGLWGLFIGQMVGHCLLAFYLTIEHNGLPHEGDIFDKTRSFHQNKLLNLIMWNMPYHAAHHAYPAVPFHALPLLQETINNEVIHHENHINFHLEVLKKTCK